MLIAGHKSVEMKKKYTFRKFVNDLHLWLGLPSALILFVMCLTGTIYVFQKEITQWVDAGQYRTAPKTDQPLLAVSDLTRMVEAHKKGSVIAIQIPQQQDGSWTFTVSLDDQASKAGTPDKAPKKEKTKSFWVDPYLGVIKGDAQTPASEFFATVLKLHRWLLIENHDIGGAITGSAAIIMIILQLTGIVLWAPAKLKKWKHLSSWKDGLSVKWGAKFKRVNFDWHKASGFYAFALVTIMAITGPYFAFKWYKTSFAAALGTKPSNNESDLASAYPRAGAQPISVEQVVSRVNQIYPYQGTIKITFPKGSAGIFTILKSRSGFFVSAGVDRLWLDQYSGQALMVQRYADKSLADKVVSSAKFIHDGEIMGTFSKILYFIACLIATSLPVTGFIIWWGKNKKAAKKSSTNAHRSIPA